METFENAWIAHAHHKVSEGLNSVETYCLSSKNPIDFSVSEGLNSVETREERSHRSLKTIAFQKDLIVWKHEVASASDKVRDKVSEGLNSVETKSGARV